MYSSVALIHPQNFSSYKTETLPPLNTSSCSLSLPPCPWYPPFCLLPLWSDYPGNLMEAENIIPCLRTVGARTRDTPGKKYPGHRGRGASPGRRVSNIRSSCLKTQRAACPASGGAEKWPRARTQGKLAGEQDPALPLRPDEWPQFPHL